MSPQRCMHRAESVHQQRALPLSLVKTVDLAQRPPPHTHTRTHKHTHTHESKPTRQHSREALGEIQKDGALQNEGDAAVQGAQQHQHFIRPVLTAFTDTRTACPQQGARAAGVPAHANQQNTLYGQRLPERKPFVDNKGEMYPKHVVHCMTLRMPPEAGLKLMTRSTTGHSRRRPHGRDGRRHGGTVDGLGDLAHGALRSGGREACPCIKGTAQHAWSDAKSSLPSTSDARRGVASIAPHQRQQQLPDALKPATPHTAKNVCALGATEACGTPDRLRQPFAAPDMDKCGCRRGG